MTYSLQESVRPTPRCKQCVDVPSLLEHICRVLTAAECIIVLCGTSLWLHGTAQLHVLIGGEGSGEDDEQVSRVHDLVPDTQLSERVIEQGLKQITCLLAQGVVGCVLDDEDRVLARRQLRMGCQSLNSLALFGHYLVEQQYLQSRRVHVPRHYEHVIGVLHRGQYTCSMLSICDSPARAALSRSQ